MVKTKKVVSVEKFELSENDITEIKANIPRLARLYIKENRDFRAAMDRNPEALLWKLDLKCFTEMLGAYCDYADEEYTSIFDCDGFDICLDTLENMIEDYIRDCGCPPLTLEDFEDDEDIGNWIDNKLQNCRINVEKLKKNGELILKNSA